MDAVEFLREHRRMCNKYAYTKACGEECSDECPLKGYYCDLGYKHTDIENTVSKVEQWSKEHPQKTMIQDFFEKFPNAPKNLDGIPNNLCPSELGYKSTHKYYCGDYESSCINCWNRPMED